MIYLDNSATTKPAKEVVDAITKVLTEDFGNPSSLYNTGLNAEKILKNARISVAKTIGANPDEVFFTSGGTESDNAALKGIWESRKKQGKRIITSCVEHPAILNTCKWLEKEGADVVYLPVDKEGLISLDDFRNALTENTILVSVMAVNNESGAIMPIAGLRKILDETNSKAILHTDAVQAWGKIDCNVNKLGVDMMSLSGHKVHGPKGIGALYISKDFHLPAFIHGGGQEKAQRSGTENMPGIAGLGAAAELMLTDMSKRVSIMMQCKTYFRKKVLEQIDNIKVNGPEDGACSVLNISFRGCRGEVILHSLDADGICVSTGSACSSHVKGSHVLTAMGLKPEEIEGAVRFSFCGDNTIDEMDKVLESLKKTVESQRRLRAAFSKK